MAVRERFAGCRRSRVPRAERLPGRESLADRPICDIHPPDLIAAEPPLAQTLISVYNTHDVEPRADQAFAGRWLAATAYPRQPPSVCASNQAGHHNSAAS